MSDSVSGKKNTEKVHSERKKGGASKQTIEELIEDTLLKDNFGLLEVICDSATVVGDAAAMWSKGILKILASKLEKDQVQAFLKRALRNRMLSYRSKSRDLSDITRDNSLVPMLLTAYARSEGESYLIQTLSKPLKCIYPVLSKCEVDPQKIGTTLASSTENVNIEKELAANRNNLEHVCEKVFQAIFDSQEKLPHSITSMCGYLTDTIEEIKTIDPSTLPKKTESTSLSQLNSSPKMPHNSLLRASTSIFKTGPRGSVGQRTSSMSNKLGSLLTKKKKNDDRESSKDNLSIVTSEDSKRSSIGPFSAPFQTFSKSVTDVNTKTPKTKKILKHNTEAPLFTDSDSEFKRRIELASSFRLSQDLIIKDSHSQEPTAIQQTSTHSKELSAIQQTSTNSQEPSAFQQSQTHSQEPSAFQETQTHSKEPSHVCPKSITNQYVRENGAAKAMETKHPLAVIVSSELLTQSPRVESIMASSDDALNEQLKIFKKERPDTLEVKCIGNLHTRGVSGGSGASGSTKESFKGSVNLGTLSLSEKIVGSFLFLRFLVPGITSPDMNGILLEKIPPASRRGLILCGKMLTALCNDTEFGYKETSLMPCNLFLEKYRFNMKKFLLESAQQTESDLSSPRLNAEITSPTIEIKKELPTYKSDFELNERPSKKQHSIPVYFGKKSHTRSLSRENPSPSSSDLDKIKGTSRSRSVEWMKTLKSSGSARDVQQSLRVDPDIQAFYHSLGGVLDLLEKEIGSRKTFMSQSGFRDLVQKYSELRIYLNTAGYIEDAAQNFKSKKSWWIKMMGFLGSH